MKTVHTDVVEEYRVLRGACGLLEHTGAALVEVSGPGAVPHLGATLTRPVEFLLEGQSTVALLLDEDAAVVAEVVVHARLDGYLLQVWPAQAAAARERLLAAPAGAGVTLTDRSDDLVVLAVEGPSSFALAAPYLDFPIASMGYRSHATATRHGHPVLVSRTGVTGEYGYTLVVPAAAADAVRRDLLDAGAVPCGLDAVDVCRMEARFVNLEREGAPGATPFDLGLQWMVDMSGAFRGHDALGQRWAAAADRQLVCWTAADEDGGADPAPRGGLEVTAGRTVVGEVAHAVHSPRLGRVVGTARLDRAVAASGLELEVGGRPVRTVSAPFLVATSFGVTID